MPRRRHPLFADRMRFALQKDWIGGSGRAGTSAAGDPPRGGRGGGGPARFWGRRRRSTGRCGRSRRLRLPALGALGKFWDGACRPGNRRFWSARPRRAPDRPRSSTRESPPARRVHPENLPRAPRAGRPISSTSRTARSISSCVPRPRRAAPTAASWRRIAGRRSSGASRASRSSPSGGGRTSTGREERRAARTSSCWSRLEDTGSRNPRQAERLLHPLGMAR